MDAIRFGGYYSSRRWQRLGYNTDNAVIPPQSVEEHTLGYLGSFLLFYPGTATNEDALMVKNHQAHIRESSNTSQQALQNARKSKIKPIKVPFAFTRLLATRVKNEIRGVGVAIKLDMAAIGTTIKNIRNKNRHR